MKTISDSTSSSIERSPAKAWLRALGMTEPIPAAPHRIFPVVIENLGETRGNASALFSDTECLTYRELAEQSNRYSRWALDQGLVKGDVVCLLMPNRPEYMAVWLGVTRIGIVVSLLNTNLSGPSLAHCIDIVSPRHIIVAAEFSHSLDRFLGSAKIWIHGADRGDFSRIDRAIESQSGESLSEAERRATTIHDTALLIYTSGTTGLPKAAKVSHFRLMQWSHWFAGMMDIRPSDRMYNCLPMYHSVGGVVATGAVLIGGGSVAIASSFSAHQFWNDILRWDCTLFQYIGELCRYLLHTGYSPGEREHRIRMCSGNGLKADVWADFKDRFRIPQILEFYAATEGNFSLFNINGKPGAIGCIPSYLAHRFTAALVKTDVQAGEPIRNPKGFCTRCDPNEVGEALGKVLQGSSAVGSRFEGYTSKEDSDKKILHNVFEPGDAWFRTGDLMRKDEKGYFYFVDRIGDTFRWKGENVATSEVSEAICSFPGVREAIVYGVAIPGADGRAGMAAIVADVDFDLAAFRTHLADRLPYYARPLFVRMQPELQITATFKHTKNDLVRDGYDPSATSDIIYFNDSERHAFVQLDKALFDRIQAPSI